MDLLDIQGKQFFFVVAFGFNFFIYVYIFTVATEVEEVIMGIVEVIVELMVMIVAEIHIMKMTITTTGK